MKQKQTVGQAGRRREASAVARDQKREHKGPLAESICCAIEFEEPGS